MDLKGPMPSENRLAGGKIGSSQPQFQKIILLYNEKSGSLSTDMSVFRFIRKTDAVAMCVQPLRFLFWTCRSRYLCVVNSVSPWHFRKGRPSMDKASELGISWEEGVGG